MKKDKLSNFKLKIIVNSKGLDYSILSYCTHKDIEDLELSKLWKKARKTLEKIKDILDNSEEEI